MKQQISLEQWNSLSDEEKLDFWLEANSETPKGFPLLDLPHLQPKIGNLIEYLGVDLHRFHNLIGHWQVNLFNMPTDDCFNHPELIDALWEATKHKLHSQK